MKRGTGIISAAILAPALTGCVERRIEITSEPSGALVWLNDQQVGRTPTEATFLFHGVYDVRLELEGYEPLRTTGEAKPPIYEHAPLDLVAEALPNRIENVQRWHFVLEPALESGMDRAQLEADLLSRAGAMRDELAAIPRPEGAETGQAGEPEGQPSVEQPGERPSGDDVPSEQLPGDEPG